MGPRGITSVNFNFKGGGGAQLSKKHSGGGGILDCCGAKNLRRGEVIKNPGHAVGKSLQMVGGVSPRGKQEKKMEGVEIIGVRKGLGRPVS